MSADPYSGASASRGASRALCATRVSDSAASRTDRLSGAFERRSHPANGSAAPPPPARARICLRGGPASPFLALLLERVTAPAPHKLIVVETRYEHHTTLTRHRSAR